MRDLSAEIDDVASAGFSPERLARLDGALEGLIAGETFAGCVAILARRGQVVRSRALGRQDLESGRPMTHDTIFRIASMTKPITGVAMMTLYEEGLWRPEDPLAAHIPEFADLQVYAGLDMSGQPRLERPRHPPTVGELMTHTAGFSYGFRPDANPIDKLYVSSGVFGRGPDGRLINALNLQDMVDKLAKIPLLYQPGERWVYSVSVDLQGYLIEKLSGQPLPRFLQQRIFEPLGMTDTAFHVPDAKRGRLATAYTAAAEGLAAVPAPDGVDREPAFASGGGGLYSTALDYARFAQMLVSRGELDGARILAPSSVRLLASNHLREDLLAKGEFGVPTLPNGFAFPDTLADTDAFAIAFYKARPGVGFGYDVSVIYDPLLAGRTVGKGTFHWDGAFGTWFWVDPEFEIFFVGMVQRADLPNIPNVQELSRVLVYQALTSEA
jgi:CubicO group peptidase (beta-lactamase class C family)